jgi:tRNA-binding protein
MGEPVRDTLDPAEFFKADLRVGRITAAHPFPEARKPAYKLEIDFGEPVGVKKSSAQITEHYTLEDLPGRLVVAVVNFPPRQIGPVRSEVLVLGTHDADGAVVLLDPGPDAPLGAQVS